MKLQPVVRTVLTFLAAALAVIVASVHDETVRLIGAALVVGLAAIGIVPPQLPTRTVVEKVKDERGYGRVSIVGVILLLIVIALLFQVSHGFSLLLLILVAALLLL
jgi:hypothetical protein